MRAAYRLFALRGSEAPTIEDVVAEAKVARGTFYNHFETRDALFSAVGIEVSAAINGMIREAISVIAEPVDRLALAFRLFVRFAVADAARGWVLLRTMPLSGPLDAGAREFISAEFEAAAATGRLRSVPLTILIDIGIGLQITTIRRILVERLAEEHIDRAAEAMLIALGISDAEAASLAHAPISGGIGALTSPSGAQ